MAYPTLLAGDIGGTKTVLGLYEWLDDGPLTLQEECFPSASFDSFEDVLLTFLTNAPSVQAAAFGVAGPVFEGRCDVTNLPWRLDEQALHETLGLCRVRLLNDLETTALGMTRLASSEWVDLNPWGVACPRGNIGVIAAGTGLGEAVLICDGDRYLPLATESGHADFAPATEQEDELLKFMRAQFPDHVSVERILSGSGLVAIYQYMRSSHPIPVLPEIQSALAEEVDAAPAITRGAMEKNDPLCRAALDIFVRIYGAEAGNLALRCLARGGIYIGGGIAAKILPLLQQGAFIQAFSAKGRFSEFLSRLPVRVAMNPGASLLGATFAASLLL